MNDLVIREVKPGEPSLVAHFYFKIFERQFSFLPNVEQYFLHNCMELFDAPYDSKMWIACEDGKIKGSVCIIYRGEQEAQLRMFGTDESMQGRGVGTQLLQTAMNYCRDKGYSHVTLWTIDICKAARHLYSKFGFRLTDTKQNTTWANYPMTEELWEYNEN